MTVWPFRGFTSPVSYLIPGVLNHSAGGSVDTLSHAPAVNIHLSTFRIFRKLPLLPHPPLPPPRHRPSSALVLRGLRQEGAFKSPPAVLASTCQVNQEIKNEGWTNVLTSETLDSSGRAATQKLLRNRQTRR